MTSNIQFSPEQMVFMEGWDAQESGKPRKAPADTFPDMVDDWLQGWDAALKESKKASAGGAG